jgi:hypothetical protein
VEQLAGAAQIVRFTWNTQIARDHHSPQPAKSFHVKRAGARGWGLGTGEDQLESLARGGDMPKPQSLTPSPIPLLQRIDHQPAQELRIEVRTLGWHAFAVAADAANVLDRRRHDKGSQLEPSSGADLPRSIPAGHVAVFKAEDDFLDVADVLGSGELGK